MKTGLVLSAIAVSALLAACQTTQQAALSPEQTDRLREIWHGKKWEGSWGGTCTGSVEVLEVSGNVGKVKYVWGQCGNSAPGTYRDNDAKFSETEMNLKLVWGTTADYRLQSDGNLRGEWRGGRGGEASGTFVRVQ